MADNTTHFCVLYLLQINSAFIVYNISLALSHVPIIKEGVSVKSRSEMAWVRHLVGKKKRRFIEDGYDLDLTCILYDIRYEPRKPGKGGEGVGT